jgi:hypothetical protein
MLKKPGNVIGCLDVEPFGQFNGHRTPRRVGEFKDDRVGFDMRLGDHTGS